MTLLPGFSEVLVSALSKRQVLDRIRSFTMVVDYSQYQVQHVGSNLFNGTIGADHFEISKILKKGDSFLPLIKGKVEATPNGCMIFLSFGFFPGASFFMVFWTVSSLLVAGLFASQQNWVNATVCLGVCLGNYSLAWFLFKRKVNEAKEILHQILDSTS